MFVGIYADEGITGTQIKNRCEFQRMIDDALNDKIDIIIAKSISRFVLKIGTEYKFKDLSFVPNKKTSIKPLKHKDKSNLYVF